MNQQPDAGAGASGRSQPGDDVMLRPGEVSRLLGVDPKTLTRWADSGRLPAVTLPSGHRRYRWREVRAVLHGTAR